MARPLLGTERNGATFISAFGETVLLQDGTRIAGIFVDKEGAEVSYADARKRRYFHLHVPTIILGTLAQKQYVEIADRRFIVVRTLEDEDYYTEVILQETDMPSASFRARRRAVR